MTDPLSAHWSDDDLADILSQIEPHDHDRIAPPPQVWENILTELEVETAAAEAVARRSITARSWRAVPLALVAASVLAAVIVGGTVLTRTTDDPPTPLAAAQLSNDDLGEPTATLGAANLRCEDSICHIDLDLDGPLRSSGDDVELWIINDTVTDMHSLGLVDGDGTFEIPPGVDPDDFPIVDLSFEPRDGDATHSGRSVLRGVLESA